jgi:hypothetical protein
MKQKRAVIDCGIPQPSSPPVMPNTNAPVDWV